MAPLYLWMATSSLMLSWWGKKNPWEFYVETVMGKTEKREVVGDLNSDKCHTVFLPGNISKCVLFTFWHLSFEIYLLLK